MTDEPATKSDIAEIVGRVVGELFVLHDVPSRSDVHQMTDTSIHDAVEDLPTTSQVQSMVDASVKDLATVALVQGMIDKAAIDISDGFNDIMDRVWGQAVA